MSRFINLTVLLLIACTNVNNHVINASVINSTLSTNNKIIKLARLKTWVDSTRILALPFRANFDTTTQQAFRVKLFEEDSIFKNDFRKLGDIYLMGLLCDTTNFYGLIFVSITAVGNAGLITFDKSADKVDLKLLTKENCVIYAGDVLSCKEYTIIRKDWSLDYFFQSVVAGAGDSSDTVCLHSTRKGLVDLKGVIELGQTIEMNCDE
jgi:hypothetical protein